MKTSDGNVIFHNPLIKEKLHCQTKDGDIKGTLAGSMSDFTYIMDTSASHSVIPSSQKNKKVLELTTRDGNINILFSEDMQ